MRKLNKLVGRIRDARRIAFLDRMGRYSRASGTDPAKRLLGRPVYVTLTTIPSRIRGLHIGIESLMRQSVRPTGILLWLSRSQFPTLGVLPAAIRNQIGRGLKIRFVDAVSSHKKLVFATRDFPDAVLVTADDDLIFPRDWLKDLLDVHTFDPSVIVANRARLIQFADSRKPLPYDSWPKRTSSLTAPSHFVLPTTGDGVVFPPGSLHSDVLDLETAHELSPTADDLWFKVMAVRNRTPCRAVAESWERLNDIPGSQGEKLWKRNAGPQGNDLQWTRLLRHYALERADFDDRPRTGAAEFDRHASVRAHPPA